MKYEVYSEKYYRSLSSDTLNYIVSDILYDLSECKHNLVYYYTNINNLCDNLKIINKVLFEREYKKC